MLLNEHELALRIELQRRFMTCSLSSRRFLGLLHMDVFHQRLEQEHGESVILTAPTVPYTLHLADGRVERIQNPSKYPVDQKAR